MADESTDSIGSVSIKSEEQSSDDEENDVPTSRREISPPKASTSRQGVSAPKALKSKPRVPSPKPSTSKQVPKSKEEKEIKAPPSSNHPSTSIMVNTAIQNINSRGGTSVQAIKKYMAAHYLIDPQKYARYIKKYLQESVESGFLIQTKGHGASGSFKLAKKPKNDDKTSKPKPKENKAEAKKAKPKQKSRTELKSSTKKTIKTKIVLTLASTSKTPKKVTSTKFKRRSTLLTPRIHTPVKNARTKLKSTPKKASSKNKTTTKKK